MDPQPYWFFVIGLIFLYLFAVLVTPRRWHPWYPGRVPIRPVPQNLLGPGGTRQLFYETFADAAPVFYMFGVDWCPHCKSAKPEFEAIKTSGVVTRYVNPEKEKQAAAGFDIQGYPTFVLVKDGQKIPYKGERTKAGFEQFLQQNL